jgi:hypothetical protein
MYLLKIFYGCVILQSSFERIVDLNNNVKSDEFREIGRLNENSFTKNREMTFPDIN